MVGRANPVIHSSVSYQLLTSTGKVRTMKMSLIFIVQRFFSLQHLPQSAHTLEDGCIQPLVHLATQLRFLNGQVRSISVSHLSEEYVCRT